MTVCQPVDEPIQAPAEHRRQDEQQQEDEPDRPAASHADYGQRSKAAEHE